jgi:SAM-dependent methyltransferase
VVHGVRGPVAGLVHDPPEAAVTCRICGQPTRLEPVGLASNGYQLNRCNTCQSVLVTTKPSDAELRQLYDRLFADGLYDFHRQEFERLRRGKIPRRVFRERLLRRAGRRTKGRRLVEIGGGTGVFAAIAQREGWSYTDYDISEEAVACQRDLGNQAVLFSASDSPPLPQVSADVLAMFEVVEHVWDLHTYLQTIREALRPGGCFIFSTPNFEPPAYQQSLRNNAPLSSPPVHLNFFTPSSLRIVLGEHGFTEVRLSSNRVRLPRRDVQFIRTLIGLCPPGTIYGLAR